MAGGSGNVDNLILNEDMISAIKPDPITFGMYRNINSTNDCVIYQGSLVRNVDSAIVTK